MVKTGIADLDPTRVLRNCTHMFVTLSRRGHNFFRVALAQQLQLQTMRAKVMRCTKHKYTRVGISFDETYELFKTDYCDKCPDRQPRPADWQYTHEWQQGENERNKDFKRGPRTKTRGRKPIGPPPPVPMPGEACAAYGLDFANLPPWWCGFCQIWFCQRQECTDTHPKHPFLM